MDLMVGEKAAQTISFYLYLKLFQMMMCFLHTNENEEVFAFKLCFTLSNLQTLTCSIINGKKWHLLRNEILVLLCNH